MLRKEKSILAWFAILFAWLLGFAVMICIINFSDRSNNLSISDAADSSWINDYKEAIHTVNFYDYEGKLIYRENVKTANCIQNVPELHDNEYIFCGWNYPNYANLYLDEYPIMEDMDIYPDYIEQQLIVLNGLSITGKDVEEIDVNEMKELLSEINDILNEN